MTTELDIARQIAAGALPSPQFFGDMVLHAIRVTGTGLAYRLGRDEHVWRAPETFLSPAFIERCAGLPVVAEHPKTGVLDPGEYADRSLGAVMFAYRANDDTGIENPEGQSVWAIARLYSDADLTGLSTSPGVVFKAGDGNTTAELGDGSTLLIEGTPSVLSHLAICEQGVWDKAGPPMGVRSDSEEKHMDDDKKPDGEMVSKALSSLGAAMDAIAKRMDRLERGDSRHRADDDDDDEAQRRRDAEREAWHREDAARCQLDDTEEEAERRELEGRGVPKPVAADVARRARKDRMSKRRDDARRDRHVRSADAAERERKEEAEKADAQTRADHVALSFGETAPPPMSGETTRGYRIRLLRRFQKHSATFKDADLHAVADDATFNGIESSIYADAIVASRVPQNLPAFGFRERHTTLPSGHRVTEFFGNETFIHMLKPDSMRVKAFNVPAFAENRMA